MSKHKRVRVSEGGWGRGAKQRMGGPKPDGMVGTYSARRRARVKTILARRDVDNETAARALNVTPGYVSRVRGA